MQTALDIEQTISACFDEQVRLHGDRVAVHTGDESVTFADLNRLATRIAADILSRRGPGAEPVALLFERGIGIVAAILAVLKAGKFYVILDASHPKDRLKQIISDSGTGLVVTDVAHRDRARRLADETIGILDIAEAGRHHQDERLNVVPSSPNDLAMIIYTSGSTGRPKGVTHTHRNVLADTRNVKSALNISPDDRFVWHTSVAFAGSARTIYSALLSGASLYPFDSKRHGFAQLSEWLVRHRITIFRTVPTTYRAFMATLADDVVFPDVRVLSMGGEPLFRPDVHAFHRHFAPHAVLVHPFGPTECMAVCWYVLPHREPFEQHKVPIGYTLPETTVQLLDEDGREVGDDEVGEIAVTSPYLSPGYWRDADRTNAVFRVAAAGGQTRVYLTGDLGTRSRDGCLTHMGRRDFQVKIRGFRIEVSEIETHLREMAAVRDVVVVGAPGESGQSRLVAYFVPNAEDLITAADLRRHLAPLLPEYMIPSVFVPMNALPRTPTGKTDRLRLPVVDSVRPELPVAFVAPRTRTEETLAALWSEALGLDRIGVHDGFVELGGDSLMALKLLSRIEQTLHTSLSLEQLMQAPTVAAQAVLVADRRETLAYASIVEIRPAASPLEASRPPLIVGPTLFGHVGEWRDLFDGSDFDRAVYGIEFHGDTPYPIDHPTLEELVAEATRLVLSRFPDGVFHLAGHSFGAHVVYELGQQLRARRVSPLSIAIVDASAYSPDGPLRPADVISMGVNFPVWFCNEYRMNGLAALWTRIKRRVSSRAATGDPVRLDPALAGEDPDSLRTVMRAFDWPNLPVLYRRRLSQSYTAVRNYRPRPTENRLLYLRSRVRKLIHRHRPDGGWGQYVRPDSLGVYVIPGDHGSALHARWKSAFLETLRQALSAHP